MPAFNSHPYTLHIVTMVVRKNGGLAKVSTRWNFIHNWLNGSFLEVDHFIFTDARVGEANDGRILQR